MLKPESGSSVCKCSPGQPEMSKSGRGEGWQHCCGGGGDGPVWSCADLGRGVKIDWSGSENGGGGNSTTPGLWRVAALSQPWGYAGDVCKHSLGSVNPF